jgi:hypothetical protein
MVLFFTNEGLWGAKVVAVYVFEAKSIQAYVTAGGRLRDMVGASEIVDNLANASKAGDLVGSVLASYPGLGHARFARRAGGSFIALDDDEDELAAFRAAYTMAVSIVAPGLSFQDALVTAKPSDLDCLASIPSALHESSTRPRLDLPFGQPAFEIAPRTGGVALWLDPDEKQPIEASTAVKRHAFVDLQKTRRGVFERLIPESAGRLEWPNEMEISPRSRGIGFPYLPGNQIVAVVHADGNRLGASLIALINELSEKRVQDGWLVLARLSEAIAQATQNAAKRACKDALLEAAHDDGEFRTLPARPLVLGGDDLTIIVRGDLAIPFTAQYLEHFETATSEALARVGEAADLPHEAKIALRAHFPSRLTACAGVVFGTAGQPIDRLVALAEETTRHAKSGSASVVSSGSGALPSSIHLHRVSGSSYGPYDDLLRGELLARADGRAILLCGGPYGIKAADTSDVIGARALPSISDLRKLADLLGGKAFPAGAIRRVLGQLRANPLVARQDYGRALEVLQSAGDGTSFRDYVALLARLGVDVDAPLPVRQGGQSTPLPDAFSILAASRSSGAEDAHAQ